MSSPIYSFDQQGFRGVVDDVAKLSSEFSHFRRAELPSAIRSEVSRAVDETLFGKNSAIHNDIQDLQRAVEKLPSEERVKNMINDAMSTTAAMAVDVGSIKANIENLVAAVNRIESKLIDENRVQVLIHKEAQSNLRWIAGITVASAAALFGALRIFWHP